MHTIFTLLEQYVPDIVWCHDFSVGGRVSLECRDVIGSMEVDHRVFCKRFASRVAGFSSSQGQFSIAAASDSVPGSYRSFDGTPNPRRYHLALDTSLRPVHVSSYFCPV